jgi:hypothetical protein
LNALVALRCGECCPVLLDLLARLVFAGHAAFNRSALADELDGGLACLCDVEAWDRVATLITRFVPANSIAKVIISGSPF